MKDAQEIRNIQTLQMAGFLDFEVREFAVHPYTGQPSAVFDTPYFQEMIIERQRAVVEFDDSGLPEAEWENTVMDFYRQGDWFKAGDPDPWEMFRYYEERYKKAHPDYKTPKPPGRTKPPKTPELHKEKYIATVAKAERTGAKYPRGAAY